MNSAAVSTLTGSPVAGHKDNVTFRFQPLRSPGRDVCVCGQVPMGNIDELI